MSTVSFLSKKFNAEIVHYHSGSNIIYSNFNKVHITLDNLSYSFRIPVKILGRLLGLSRLARRAFRLDKMNVKLSTDNSCLLVVYQTKLYRFELKTKKLELTGQLELCRNVLHQGILSLPQNQFVLGEYGANKERSAVKIWSSADGARTWFTAYEFPQKTIKHIHGTYFDPYTQNIWVTTGDFSGECFIYIFNLKWELLEKLGDGNQKWRTVSLFFREESVYWIMDSQFETSCLMRLNRKTKNIEQLREFPGPVWYIKDLADGVALAATANETGPGVKSKYAHIFMSTDMENWQEIAKFKKDIWPMRYFKFGVIAFADGEESSNDFYFFGEALKGLDGVAKRASLLIDESLQQSILSFYSHNLERNTFDIPSIVLTKPKPKIINYNDTVFFSISDQLFSQSQLTSRVQDWLEKIRLFIEVNKNNLIAQSKERFGTNYIRYLEQMSAMMAAYIQKECTLSFQNALLYISDSIDKENVNSPILRHYSMNTVKQVLHNPEVFFSQVEKKHE